jgi:hypothetical protein
MASATDPIALDLHFANTTALAASYLMGVAVVSLYACSSCQFLMPRVIHSIDFDDISTC